ncbi:hypothetical protein DOY81_001129, partial [Sarcophaga bullata]
GNQKFKNNIRASNLKFPINFTHIENIYFPNRIYKKKKKLRMKIFLLMIYVAHHLLTSTEGYATNQQKYVKRMIPNLYADFALTDDSNIAPRSESRISERDCQNSAGSCSSGIAQKDSGSKKAISIAQKAAQEAKAASEAQQEAGQAASRQVKMQLAEKAMQAAKAAEAALAGKQEMVETLEQEVREAEIVLQEQSASLQNAQQNVQAAMQAYQQAQSQFKTLTTAVQIAQSNVGNAEQAANGAQQELNEKNQLMEAAKCRVDQLMRQLNVARTDFASTKQAAYKAICAAREAEANAQRNRRHMMQRHAFLTPQQRQQLLEQRRKRHEHLARGLSY